jgi:hypothetical protein
LRLNPVPGAAIVRAQKQRVAPAAIAIGMTAAMV